MAVIVLAVIIAMAVVLGAGELANKADPTTTTYTPRPEWYFFFLFELLRVIKPPSSSILATVGIPTLAMVLLAAAAVLRPQPGAASRAPADRDHRRRSRRSRRWPTSPTWARTPRRPTRSTCTVPAVGSRPGRRSRTSPGCGACHKFGEAGNAGPGPDLTKIGARLPAQAIARTLRNPTAPMPSYAGPAAEEVRRARRITSRR